jgi:hypothetical protein
MKEAVLEITTLLKAGQLRSLIRIVDGRCRKLRDQELQPEFWEQIALRSAYELRPALHKWEMERRSQKALPDWWAEGSYHVYVDRDGINRNFSPAAKPTPSGPRPDSSRTPGRKARYDWKGFVVSELFKILHFEGVPDNDYALSKRLIKSCEEKLGRAPDEREIRRYLAEVLRPARQFRDSP